jgi:hypothetical protein
MIKKNEIAFSNQISDFIFNKNGESLPDNHLMDKKIFKVYRKDNDAEKEDFSINHRSNSNSKSMRSDEDNHLYTLRDLINKKSSFWEDKIFEVLDNNHPEKRFKFIHLKVKKIKERGGKSAYLKEKVDESDYKTLIQIIDMSDKMLYNEVKAEQSFLTLINATVSHELRNPLASLIG